MGHGPEGAAFISQKLDHNGAYSASARTVSGILTTVGAAGNAGRAFMQVEWTMVPAVAATKV